MHIRKYFRLVYACPTCTYSTNDMNACAVTATPNASGSPNSSQNMQYSGLYGHFAHHMTASTTSAATGSNSTMISHFTFLEKWG